ncbi:myb-like protein A [Drosophila tropicalis]|uniref:myb-like protein A n=1 Tax=Drosophila tropicalis TaxID=46794 RepID=UPI0035ABD4CA
MVDVFQRSCDGINTVVGLMQSMRVTDVRQILDFISLHHVEVILGLCFFLLMQFTKFTGVLLLAIAIAFGIFYMWDTYFPELSQRRLVNTGTNYYYNERNVRDAQSSARLPPFINTSTNNSYQEVNGGYQKVLRDIGTYTTLSSGQSSPRYSHNRMVPVLAPQATSSRATAMSGAHTPLGHLGSMANQALSRGAGSGNRFEDRQYNRQSSYNESGSTDYRSSRNARQSAMYQDDKRSRRTRGSSINDGAKPAKSRRSATDRPSSARRPYTNELDGYERKPYTTAAGPSTPSYRSNTPISGNHFAKSAQYSTSGNRSQSERENQNQRNQKTPIQSGNNTPNRHRSSRRNSNQ